MTQKEQNKNLFHWQFNYAVSSSDYTASVIGEL